MERWNKKHPQHPPLPTPALNHPPPATLSQQLEVWYYLSLFLVKLIRVLQLLKSACHQFFYMNKKRKQNPYFIFPSIRPPLFYKSNPASWLYTHLLVLPSSLTHLKLHLLFTGEKTNNLLRKALFKMMHNIFDCGYNTSGNHLKDLTPTYPCALGINKIQGNTPSCLIILAGHDHCLGDLSGHIMLPTSGNCSSKAGETD